MNAKTLRVIAGECGLNEKAVERILASVRVDEPSLAEVSENTPPPRTLELGFGVLASLRGRSGGGALGERTRTAISSVLRAYATACPKVSGWIGRGDFDPHSPPADVTKALLVHACRTAGRLRAKLLREAPEVRTM